MMNEPERGMIVMGPNGQLGTVDDLIYENPGTPPRLLVRQDSGAGMMLQSGTYSVERGMVHVATDATSSGASEDALVSATAQTGMSDIYRTQRLEGVGVGSTASVQGTTTSGDASLSQRLNEVGRAETLEIQPGQPLVVPVIREELLVTRREIERGGVRVHKRVEEREEVVEQPAFREEVTVERVPLGQAVEAAIGSRQEGDTLIIPVLEEMLVVEKRLVLKEEIRITKRRIQENEQARIVLREEHVDIENIDGSQPVA